MSDVRIWKAIPNTFAWAVKCHLTGAEVPPGEGFAVLFEERGRWRVVSAAAYLATPKADPDEVKRVRAEMLRQEKEERDEAAACAVSINAARTMRRFRDALRASSVQAPIAAVQWMEPTHAAYSTDKPDAEFAAWAACHPRGVLRIRRKRGQVTAFYVKTAKPNAAREEPGA